MCTDLAALLSPGQGASLSGAMLRAPWQSMQLTLLQLDRTQILPLAVLQLLRHAASRGATCGGLRVLHENDSPELRLDAHGHDELTVLGVQCGSSKDQERIGPGWARGLLDFRCHVPQQPGAVQLPSALRRCVQSLAQLDSGPDAAARALRDALGAEGDELWRAVASRAGALLSPGGIEASVFALAGASSVPPPCCSFGPCNRAAPSNASRPRARSGVFAPPPALPQLQLPPLGQHATRPAGETTRRAR